MDRRNGSIEVVLEVSESPGQRTRSSDEYVIMPVASRNGQHTLGQCPQTALCPVPFHGAAEAACRGKSHSYDPRHFRRFRGAAGFQRETGQRVSATLPGPQEIGAIFHGYQL
jgi:hypothetical protein